MAENYKEYNNYSEKEKESMMAANSTTSNQNEATIISNTDELEAKLDTLHTDLASLATRLETLASKLDTIDISVNARGQAIVDALTPEPEA